MWQCMSTQQSCCATKPCDRRSNDNINCVAKWYVHFLRAYNYDTIVIGMNRNKYITQLTRSWTNQIAVREQVNSCAHRRSFKGTDFELPILNENLKYAALMMHCWKTQHDTEVDDKMLFLMFHSWTVTRSAFWFTRVYRTVRSTIIASTLQTINSCRNMSLILKWAYME